MSTKLVAQSRTATGSSAARRLRAEGHIPGVLYGHGMAPVSVTVERRELRLALSGPAGANTVLALEVERQELPGRGQGAAAPPDQAHGQPHRLPQGQHERGAHGARAAAPRGRGQGRRRRGWPRRPVGGHDRGQLHPGQHAERVRHRHHRDAARTTSSASPTCRCRRASPRWATRTCRSSPSSSRPPPIGRGTPRPRATKPPPRATPPPPSDPARRRDRRADRRPGQPGREYARTRHNVGEEIIGLLAARLGETLKAGRDKAAVADDAHGRQAGGAGLPAPRT